MKSKISCVLWGKKINLIKTKRNRKWKIPQTVLESRNLCFSSYKSRKLTVTLWWVGVCERKKRAFFVPFILSEGNFFKICLLSQCIVYWIHFQNIHTFTYQKTLLHTLLSFISKIVESLQCILKIYGIKSCLDVDSWYRFIINLSIICKYFYTKRVPVAYKLTKA